MRRRSLTRPGADDIEAYAERAYLKALALLRAAAFDLRRRSVGVRAIVGAEGDLRGLTVVRSSGCRYVDRIAELALCKMYVPDPPDGVAGHILDLDLGGLAAA